MNARRTDFELLRDFVRQGDQPAFADLVGRHVNLVYGTALRKVDDAGAAQEICQDVFAALARKSWRFGPEDSIPAWLHRTTLLEAREWWRGELRRRRREQTAAETTMKTPEDQAATLLPLLDEALLSLRESDRAALLLRFCEDRSLRDVGGSLGVSEDTAQKRVAGALEKLARFFQRRGFRTAGVTVAAAALRESVTAAPVRVASALVQSAVQTAPPALAGFASAAGRFMGLTWMQAAAVTVAIVTIPAVWQWDKLQVARTTERSARAQLNAAENEYDTLRTELEDLRLRSARLESSLADARQASAQRVADPRLKLDTWKSQIRARLLGDDYRWPADSPFVRIPKSVLKDIQVRNPLIRPGGLGQAERELLGMTPDERRQMEQALNKYLASQNKLIETGISDLPVADTNTNTGLRIPRDAIARQIWSVPALGNEQKALGDALESEFKATLGSERWDLLDAGAQSYIRILNLDAMHTGQEIAAWIQPGEGCPTVGFTWTEGNRSLSSGGPPLSIFLPQADGTKSSALEKVYGLRDLSDAISSRVLEWYQQQARLQFGNGGAP